MIKITEGDITKIEVDAIVNAANSALSGGGGVDGAIHRAAGPELKEACRRLGRCPPGNVVITQGFRLRAKWVLHAVGPVWDGGSRNEAEQLASCFRKSLEIAHSHNIGSIAFPAISCGVYRYPLDQAAQVAVCTLMEEIRLNEYDIRVEIICFERKVRLAFEKAYNSQKLCGH